MSNKIAINEDGMLAYEKLFDRMLYQVDRTNDIELTNTYNAFVTIFEELEAYISDLEIDNMALAHQSERADKLQVYIAMLQRAVFDEKARAFVRDIGIQKHFRYTDNYNELFVKAMGYKNDAPSYAQQKADIMAKRSAANFKPRKPRLSKHITRISDHLQLN